MTLAEIDGLLAWMLAISAGLGALAVIWNRGVKPVAKFLKTLVEVGNRLEEAIPVLEDIAKEFKPNHGHSLKDVTRRMDRNIRANAANNVILYRIVASLPGVDPGLFEPLNELESAPPDEG